MTQQEPNEVYIFQAGRKMAKCGYLVESSTLMKTAMKLT